jgi:hypothetical protein
MAIRHKGLHAGKHPRAERTVGTAAFIHPIAEKVGLLDNLGAKKAPGNMRTHLVKLQLIRWIVRYKWYIFYGEAPPLVGSGGGEIEACRKESETTMSTPPRRRGTCRAATTWRRSKTSLPCVAVFGELERDCLTDFPRTSANQRTSFLDRHICSFLLLHSAGEIRTPDQDSLE